jgi:hypothetical protein
MSDTPTPEELNKALFVNLVMMFSQSTLVGLGKLANPMTGKVESPNLESAQQGIDLLVMLDAKTRGNLDRDEARLLKDSLSNLQMNFVETAADLKKAPPPPSAGSTPAPAPAQAPAPETTEPPPSGSEPKFRKSYGA